MKYLYYVVLRRMFQEEDIISIHDFKEAVELNWIGEDGNRIWVVPPEAETSITFVWGFYNLDKAIAFYETLQHNELGMMCQEL